MKLDDIFKKFDKIKITDEFYLYEDLDIKKLLYSRDPYESEVFGVGDVAIQYFNRSKSVLYLNTNHDRLDKIDNGVRYIGEMVHGFSLIAYLKILGIEDADTIYEEMKSKAGDLINVVCASKIEKI